MTNKQSRLAGYAFALCAGAIWGTTGPLSTALYAESAKLTAVGFWRITLATIGFLVYGIFARDLFKIDKKGLLIVGVLGGALVALFEVAYQYAIAGVGVAGASALLYTAPVMVAVLAYFFLQEALTPLRIALAVMVMVGVSLTVNGAVNQEAATHSASRFAGIVGGFLSAGSYAGTAVMARFAVPRYGAVKVLFWEILGGTVILGILLPLMGQTPSPPSGVAAWSYIVALGIGAVLAANFFFFAAVKRIDAAPTAVAASIEPLVGSLLALLMFDQQLRWFGWLGLLMVIGGVASGYKETEESATAPSSLVSAP
jgi:DME family drug/metabolite transporter